MAEQYEHVGTGAVETVAAGSSDRRTYQPRRDWRALSREELFLLVGDLPIGLPELLGVLKAVRGQAWRRLNGAAAPPPPSPPTWWLTVAEAAEIARSSRRQICEWSAGKRWARRPSLRKIIIDEAGFRAWLAARV